MTSAEKPKNRRFLEHMKKKRSGKAPIVGWRTSANENFVSVEKFQSMRFKWGISRSHNARELWERTLQRQYRF